MPTLKRRQIQIRLGELARLLMFLDWTEAQRGTLRDLVGSLKKDLNEIENALRKGKPWPPSRHRRVGRGAAGVLAGG